MSTGPTRSDDPTRTTQTPTSSTRPQEYSGKWTSEETDPRELSTENAPLTFSYSSSRYVPNSFDTGNAAMLARHLFETDAD